MSWRMRPALSSLSALTFPCAPYSSSAVPRSPRSSSSPSTTTTRPPGSRTSSPPSPARRPRSSCPPRSTSSRPVSRTETLTTPRAASASCPTWPGTRVSRPSSRDWCPRFVLTLMSSYSSPPSPPSLVAANQTGPLPPNPAPHDRPQARLFLLARPDADPSL